MLVSLQEHDGYCDAIAGRMIDVMNTSANTNPRATTIGFRRRMMAGALLAMEFTAIAVGFAATSHADPSAPAPNIQSPSYAPAPPAGSWLQPIDPGCRAKLFYFNGRWHCG